MPPSIIRRPHALRVPRLARPFISLRAAVNTWLDKSIIDGWFLEGFIIVAIGLCALVLEEKQYTYGVLFAFLYVFMGLLKYIAIELDDLRNARGRTDYSDASIQKKRNRRVRRTVKVKKPIE